MYSCVGFRSLLKILCLLLAFGINQTGADNEANDCLFVSHQSGQDSPLCGSVGMPCQSLPQALLLVSDGGKICLDGTNSESHPYSCERMDDAIEILSNGIEKSVAIQGWLSKAHIFCKRLYGLAFRRAGNRILELTLSNLVFHNNGVILSGVNCFNVIITNCSFVNNQIAVVITQGESRVCKTSSLVITGTDFLYNNVSVFVYLFNEFFILKISRCVFQGKVGRFKVISDNRSAEGAVYIQSRNFKNRVHVLGSITDSIFRELAHEYNGFALSFRVHDIYSTGNLSILNTTFLNNENALFFYGGFDVRLVRVTINSTYGYAIIAGGPPKVRNKVVGIKVFLDQCILANNKVGIRMAMTACLRMFVCAQSSQTLVVKNSLFLGGNETRGVGDTIRFGGLRDSGRPIFIKAEVILRNVTFQKLHNCALFVRFRKNVKGHISVKNCKFLNNSEFVYRLNERATIQIEFDEEEPPKCLKQRNNRSKFIRNNTSQIPVIFEDNIFEGNIGIAGALVFLNGNVTFKNCSFKDNEGITLGGHVYMKTGYGSLTIVNSTFLQTRLNGLSKAKQRRISSNGCFLHSMSAGPVIITNTSFTANVNKKFYPILSATKSSTIKVDATSSLRCPSGRRVKLEKIEKTEGFDLTKGSEACWMRVNYVKLFCEECPDEFYSLQRGLTTGLDINKKTVCLKCPYGASCENGNVKAKENFWGFNMSTSPPSLQFFPCPLEYCSSPMHSKHYTYNRCHGNRSGVLCGKCSDGYSEVLYTTSCRKNAKCNDHWFWLASAIYIIVFAVYFVFKPPIFSELYKQSLWFRNTPESSNDQSMPHRDEKGHDSGYLKIIFYFYQVAELVMINSPEKALHMVPFIPAVIAIFNFQVKSLNGSIGCPFPGLSVVTKELFQCLKFLATLLSTGFIYAIHRAASKTRYISAPSLTLYLAVALETLLLGYETLADTTLKLMHCVSIGMDWRLFVDGNIQCWQWWQYLLIAFIVAFIIPLILVLFWGSLMLAKDRVLAKEFLIACAFPLPCLLVWIIRCYKKKEDEGVLFTGNRDDAEEIKKVLHDAFREASDDDHGSLYWESVLTGRRLILLTIHTFATDPMVRFLCMTCACVAILAHHLIVRPFRDRKVNNFESLSLASLVAICTFSLAEATYFSEGIEPTGPSKNLFHALQWIEIGLLSLVPLTVCILVVFAALSQVFRLLYHCIRILPQQLMRCKCSVRQLSIRRLSNPRPFIVLDWEPEDFQSVE